MSEIYDEDEVQDRQPPRSRSRGLVITATVLVAGFFALTAFASLYTDHLWYQSVDFASVFDRLLWTKVGLFVFFGLLMFAVSAASIYLAFRYRPLIMPGSDRSGLDRYRSTIAPVSTWVLVSVSAVLGLFAGSSATGQWRSFMLWRSGVPFGQKDAYYRKDIGFYVFDLPWLHYVVDSVMAMMFIGLLVSATTHYLYGGIRLQDSHDRLSGAAQVQLSALLGVFVLAKAADYWLDRYDLVTDTGRLITGMTYTDDHAVLPAKSILMFIALICAVLFFLNMWRRTWLLPSVGLVLLVISSILLGVIWPGFVQQVQVNPTEADKEQPYIAANIKATRAAYDLQDWQVQDFTNQVTSPRGDLAALDSETSSIPLVDPQLVHATFEQTQQVRSYYSVAPVLDVDHYIIDGIDRALVLGVRELDQNGIQEQSRNWSNLHTVYTHGNGVIAAFANQRTADNSTERTDIQWAEGQQSDQHTLSGLDPQGYESRVYFGEQSPSYSIVGKQSGKPSIELDLGNEADSADQDQRTTYDGAGGVPVGSLFHQLLYAMKFGEPNFVLSGRVNANSKVLYNRDPRTMVEKVAPWLTVDSDPYPAVIDGRIVWLLDGYTTTDRYPLSQRASLKDMTDDSLNRDNQFGTLPTDEINYMRNAVKATVDAYDGTVHLYQWDTSDPMLQAWMKAFPGTVESKTDIPPDVLAHMRYPEDQFKVQRYQFARYHVTDASDFFLDSNRWEVPADPYADTTQQPPYRLFVNQDGSSNYSLTSVYVPSGKQNLAAFVSVNADATASDYGAVKVLQLPNEQTQGPSQVATEMSTSEDVRGKLADFNLGEAKPVFGNLLTLPIGKGLMYVQPVYAARDSSTSYPILKAVIVSYGGQVGIGTTIGGALSDVLGAEPSVTPPPSGNDGNDGGKGKGGKPSKPGSTQQQIDALLSKADAAFAAADQAQRSGDSVEWAKQIERARTLVARAVRLSDSAPAPSGGTGTRSSR